MILLRNYNKLQTEWNFQQLLIPPQKEVKQNNTIGKCWIENELPSLLNKVDTKLRLEKR